MEKGYIVFATRDTHFNKEQNPKYNPAYEDSLEGKSGIKWNAISDHSTFVFNLYSAYAIIFAWSKAISPLLIISYLISIILWFIVLFSLYY